MIELKILGSFITASATILVALAIYIWKIQREKKRGVIHAEKNLHTGMPPCQGRGHAGERFLVFL